MSIDIKEGVTYEVTLKLRVRFVDASDSHGRCFELQAEKRDFDYNRDRRMWVDEDEVIAIAEAPRKARP